MCQDIDHGGIRCPVDTTSQRRYRRKTSTILQTYNITPLNRNAVALAERDEKITYENVKEHVNDVKKRLTSSPPEGTTLEKWDAENEILINQIGLVLAEEADKRVPVSIENIQNTITQVQSSIYNKNLEQDKLSKETKKLSSLLTGPIPDVNTMPGKMKYASLSDEDKLIVDKINELKESKKTLLNETKKLDEEQTALIYRTTAELKESYLSVLQEIRPFGGEIEFEGNASDQAFIQKTLGSHYPQEWIKRSNEAGAIEIVSSNTSRPEYRSPKVPLSVADVNGKAHIISETFKNYETQHFTTDINTQGLSVFYPDVEVSTEGKITGQHPSLAQGNIQTAEEYQETLTKEGKFSLISKDSITYRAPLTSAEQKIIGEDILKEVPAGTLYHEFGHRMEQVLPENILVRQEKAFLRRRTGKPEGEWFTNLTPMSRTEFAHKGDFAAPYVGKEYFDSRRYEVFTTGIQSLYSGEYGGLLGLSPQYRQPDTDHRNFILGILATL